MPSLDFPSSPTLNQTYSFAGKTWAWNGTGWALATAGTGGVIVNYAYAENANFSGISAAMAGGADAIPQQTDGTQMLTCTITPRSATNKLRIHVSIPWAHSIAGSAVWFALFQDNAAPAITTHMMHAQGGLADYLMTCSFDVDITAGTTNATTIKLRGGMFAGVSGGIYLNGNSSGRRGGGSQRIVLSILEEASPVSGPGAGAAPGSLVLIQQQIVTSAVANVNFTSGIDATYDEYRVEITGLQHATSGQNLIMRVSTDGGATWATGANYVYAYSLQCVSAGNSAFVGSGASALSYIILSGGLAIGSNTFADFSIRLFTPWRGATSRKNVFFQMFGIHASLGDMSCVGGGSVLGLGAYNGIRFQTFDGSNIAAGTFNLYGVKK